MVKPADVSGQIQVIVKDADANGGCPWSAPWRLESRLIPIRSVDRAGGMGEASFKILRRHRNEGGQWINDAGCALGSYVGITVGSIDWLQDPASAASNEHILWWGFIATRSLDTVINEADEMGSVTALGYGHLMDRRLITGFRQVSQEDGGEVLSSTPIANPETQEGTCVGNYTDTPSSPPGKFTRAIANLSITSADSFWTRRRLIEHIIKCCVPTGLPPLRLFGHGATEYGTDEAEGGVLDFLELDERISFDLSNVTFKGALDLLIPRARGLTWSLWPRQDHWLVWVDSLAPTASGDLPANTATDIELNDLPLVSVNYGQDLSYDSVTLEGAKIIHGFTVSYEDDNLDKGWSSEAELGFKAGASGATGFSSQGIEGQRKDNAATRGSLYGDVFTRYVLKVSGDDGNLYRYTMPGASAGSLAVAIPRIEWDGEDATVGTVIETPYMPTARLEKVVPWPVGIKGDGTDVRTTEQKANPVYLETKVFRYDSTASTARQWLDLTTPYDTAPTPAISVDDRGPALSVKYQYPEMMAKGQWDETGWSVTGLKPNPQYNQHAVNYNDLVATVAMQSDQRISITTYKAGFTAATTRNPLVIRDEKYKCWVVHAGTILGIGTGASGSPDRVVTTTFTRDDWDEAQLALDAIAAFALAVKRPVTIELVRADLRYAWAEVGELVGRLIKRKEAPPGQTGAPLGPLDVNSTVESVERVYGGEPGDAPRTIIRTVASDMVETGKGRGGAFTVSPSGGGQVSVVLGGTVPAAVQSAGNAQHQADSRSQRSIITPASPGPEGFWAEITAATFVDDNIWKYDWREIRFVWSAGRLNVETPVSGGASGPWTEPGTETTGYAWNTMELNNTETASASGWFDEIVFVDGTATWWEIDAVRALYDPGGEYSEATPRPIVWLRRVGIKDGGMRVAYVFAGWNAFAPQAGPA